MGVFVLGSFFGAGIGVTGMCLAQMARADREDVLELWYFSAVEIAVFQARLKEADTRELLTARAALEQYKAQGYHVATGIER